MEEKTLDEIAYEEGLEYIETTSERNGYPSNIREAIIGFDNFDQAEELAKKYGLIISYFDKRDGWQLWHRGGRAYEPFERSCKDYGDNYNEEDDSEEFMRNELEIIGEISFGDTDDVRSWLDEIDYVCKMIDEAEDDEIVITCNGRYYETIKKHTMRYAYDTKHYAIGLEEEY